MCVYWNNGQLKRFTQFQENLRHGLDQMWNESGVLVDSGSYEKGVAIGVHRRWNDQGILIEEMEFSQGKCVSFRSWNDEGEVLCAPSFFCLMDHYPKLALILPTLIPAETPFEFVKPFDIGNAEGVYVYGLGMGGPYEQLKSWLHAKKSRKLIFLEDDEGHLASFLHSKKVSLLSDPQVHLEFFDSQEIATIVEKFPIETVEVVAVPSKSKIKFRKLKLDLLRKSTRSFSLTQEKLHGDIPFGNFVKNIKHLPSSFYVNKMKNAFLGIPAIVCGAGPSLQEAIPLLKQLSNQALIIAGGSTLAALSSQGVPIHFGLAIDPNLEEYRRMRNSFAFDTPLFYTTRVHPKIFQTCGGPFGYMRSGIGGMMEVWLEEALGLTDPLIGSDLSVESVSVTNICAAVAEFLGCSTILFSGVDLAYTKGKRYADGVDEGGDILFSQLGLEKAPADQILKRKNHLNQDVLTAIRWVMEGASLSDFAKKHKKTRFVNTSSLGLKMEGIPYMSLELAATKYLRQTFDLKAMVGAEIAKASMPDTTSQVIEEKMGELRTSLLRMIDCLEVLSEKKKGSTALAELDLEEEMAGDLLFYDLGEVLSKSARSALEKWSLFLSISNKYVKCL